MFSKLHSKNLFFKAYNVPIVIVSLLNLLLCLKANGQDSLSKAFKELLQRGAMTVNMPDSFKVVPVVTNGQMKYDYAIKYYNKNFEIRYAIHPLDEIIKVYGSKDKKEGTIMTDPNKLYFAAFQNILFNLSAGTAKGFKEYDPAAVNKEFNADWGALTVINVAGDFGKGYKYCAVIALHKNNAADAYVFCLTDSQDNFKDLLQKVFHTLTFKDN